MDQTGSSSRSWCEEIYHRKGRELLLYGRALGLSHSEAEDVLQETFVALMKLEGAPRQPDHYCIRAYRHRAANYKRSFWRRVAREFESLAWFEERESETGAERQAMDCLAKLPKEQQEVIVLKVWHGLTFEELGELLEISQNTAAGRYRYGMQKLRACLTEKELYERSGIDREADEGMAAERAIEAIGKQAFLRAG
ncbi:MAG: sigma-70 family RNA polymerase sigma factor [Verrucomicrobiota bacterium]|nr:sigma-70 family RNA polymerase sigma factor [Verrucomicrobiota bacterium]